MKFATEKKTTLCIYTEAEFGTEKMECEVRALRRELEETRTALRLQTVRCRQLVAAFTTKLQEKEAEVRAGRELRDQQLGRVLRALLVLEARLRREQRHIRQQLSDRDTVIRTQQQEIDRLHQMRRIDQETADESQENKKNTEKESLETSGADETAEHRYDASDWKEVRNPQEIQDDSTSSQEDEPVRHKAVTQSLGYHELKTSQSTAFVRFKKNSRSKLNNLGSYRPITRRRELTNVEKSFSSQDHNTGQSSKNFDENNLEYKETISESQELEDSGCHEDEFGTRDLYKDYQHNPVLECVNQILLRDQEEMETTRYRQESLCKPDSKATGRFNYHCHSIKEEQDEENSSEGEEEVVEKQVENPTVESSLHSDNITASSDKDICTDKGKETTNEPFKLSVKDKTPSPPIKAQLLEEKACLLMASQRLTLARNLEFEELDKKDTSSETPDVPPPCPPKGLNGFSPNKGQVPPALPPKPPQLGAKGLYQKKVNNVRFNQSHNPLPTHQEHIVNGNASSQEQQSCSRFRSNHTQDANQFRHDNPDHKNPVEQNSKPFHHHEPRKIPPHLPDKPRQRQILSNGSLKLALNQESNQQILSNGHDHHQEKNNNFCVASPSFKDKLDNLNLSDFHNHSNTTRHQSRGGVSVTNNQNNNQLNGLPINRHNHNHEPRRHKATLHNHCSQLKGSMEELSNAPKTPPAINKNSNHCGKIRVGSSVSSLITGSSGNSIVNELTKGEAEEVIVLPRVSQMVRRFEDLGTGVGRDSPEDDEDDDDEGNNALRRNFEEFKLEDVDMDSVGSSEDGGRPAGDGAEARAAVIQNGTGANSANGGSYEHFLEATGLSQKSILTPSRMYSNHRNVLKPKDVKHRSRVLKAAAVNEKSNNVSNGPVVKYWIEPFL